MAVPHTIRPEVRNVLDVQDLEAEQELLADRIREAEREVEQAGTEELRPTALPEKD